MVLSTTFALAQRHERREMNGNNKMTLFLAGMSSYPAEGSNDRFAYVFPAKELLNLSLIINYNERRGGDNDS